MIMSSFYFTFWVVATRLNAISCPDLLRIHAIGWMHIILWVLLLAFTLFERTYQNAAAHGVVFFHLSTSLCVITGLDELVFLKVNGKGVGRYTIPTTAGNFNSLRLIVFSGQAIFTILSARMMLVLIGSCPEMESLTKELL